MVWNSTEWLVTIWSRENPLLPIHRRHRQPAFHYLQVWYYADFKGVEVRLISLNCCTVTVVPHIALPFPRELLCFRAHSNVCVFKLVRNLALAASVALSERVISENSRSSYSRRVLKLERIVLLMIA